MGDGIADRARSNRSTDANFRRRPSGVPFWDPSRSPLAEPKLSPPPLREGTVSRTALLEFLRPTALATVALIGAPAGYGKTTLLAEVAAGAQRRPFAWLTAEEQDNDPARLIAALSSALVKVGGVDRADFEGLGKPRTSLAAATKRLGTALSQAGPIELAVDDLHLLTSERSITVLETVATHLPPRSRLLLASRNRLPDALAVPRDGARLIELGREDLRMSEDEAKLLFKGAGLDIAEEGVLALLERMEGWPTGLYLAALVLQTDGEALSSFDGSDRFVRDYFREECLSRLEDEDVGFLERASVLNRLSGALCDHALRVSGSATRLKQLARSNLFVIPISSGKSRAYRLHTAFRDALRAELQRREPDRARSIAGRAADWSTRHGDDEQAVSYAWAAGRYDDFAALIEASAISLYHAGGLATIERWLSWPDDRLLAQHPSLAVWRAVVRTLRGQDEEALRWLELATQASVDTPDASSESMYLDAWPALIRSAMCQSGLERMREDAALALDALDALDAGSQWRSAALLLLGVSHVVAGEIATAEEVLSEAQTTAAISGAKDTFCVALAERALLEVAAGRWNTAEAFATSARSVLQESQLDDYPTSALTYAASARSAVQRSDWVRARTDVERTTHLLPMLTLALPWLAVQVRLELARAQLELSEHGAAAKILAEAEELLAQGPDLGTLGPRAEAFRRELDKGSRPDDHWEHLTPAELRLLPLLTTHLSFREIAEILKISRNTVKTQAICVYRKLDVSSRSAAIERASELGLVEKPEVLELSRENR
jgi:LuxR family transcriptional regulator, maltose regulon positive regulatory protein